MNKLILTNKNPQNYITIPTDFIDIYMPLANGEYVKIYLYLLRALADSSLGLSICDMADLFDLTEKDIHRGLVYWEKAGLLKLGYQDEVLNEIAFLSGNSSSTVSEPKPISSTPVSSTSVNSTPIVEKKNATEESEVPYISPEDMDHLTEDENFADLLGLAQYYLKKPITSNQRNQLGYCYLLFQRQNDIIEYLMEYCIEQGHSALSYMQKVAINWHQDGLLTLEKIKSASITRSKNVYGVMRAFGLSNRQPVPKEIEYIQKWSKDFSLEMILLACEKTVAAIHSPSFEYTDSILRAWTKQNVKNKTDVDHLDQLHKQNSGGSKKTSGKTTTAFHNFEQRDTDYDALVANYYGYK